MTTKEKNHALSIIHSAKIRYPCGGDYFSPDESFPEYRLGHISKKKNDVYRAVRQCFSDAGLDKKRFGTPEWNPLSDYILPGQKVFVLCNFVQHNFKRKPELVLAKCTHGSVVRAVIDYVLLATGDQGSVSFGNAPLQSCDWEKVISETGANKVEEFYTSYCGDGVAVKLRDLRQQIMRTGALGIVETSLQGTDADYWVAVDLAEHSLLEQLYGKEHEPALRVHDYDYRKTEKCHARGRHTYLVSNAVLECDVIISVPKLKTHEKVGMSCGIKGCVGTVAQKDCLAHHRFGSPKTGGDDFPDRLSYLRLFSRFHDIINTKMPGPARSFLHLLDLYSRKVLRRFTRTFGGAWPGNDTCWRMALDLARIVEHADKQGRLWPARKRQHLMVTDGIVGGDGNGPLSPRPVHLGYLSFSDNVAIGDYINCLVMGFDPQRLPMIREAFSLNTYPLADTDSTRQVVIRNGKATEINALWGGISKKFLPPREWHHHL